MGFLGLLWQVIAGSNLTVSFAMLGGLSNSAYGQSEWMYAFSGHSVAPTVGSVPLILRIAEPSKYFFHKLGMFSFYFLRIKMLVCVFLCT